eukprot:gnl/Trimastix_PCT/888.p1 GENE.gnl/Trimastix_PCT/888~~gnl/Trimastix_PCT/888.p1  ORF type:complete len:353 (+),score=10.35 gnl/Trimastix_PCT/888:302-1360(+)
MGTLEKCDKEVWLGSGIRKYFVVQGFQDLILALDQKSAEEPVVFRTFDCTTMYTKFDQGELIRAVQECMDQASRRTRSRGVGFVVPFKGNDPARWDHVVMSNYETKSDVLRITLQGAKELVGVIVGNTYLQNGDLVSHQVMGIPMGTNASPGLANLRMYDLERRYIEGLSEQSARDFELTYRLIDDILFINNGAIDEHIGPMYETPSNSVELTESTLEDRSRTQFIGLSISSLEGKFVFCPYDKRRDFKFPVTMYPHYESNINHHIPWGVVWGQLHRFNAICTRAEDFVKWAYLLFARAVVRMYPVRKLRKLCGRFARSHARADVMDDALATFLLRKLSQAVEDVRKSRSHK